MHLEQLSRLAAILLLGIFVSSISNAQLNAHFETTQLDYDSGAGDCDFSIAGTPTCELYFNMGIFTSGDNQQGGLHLYPTGCTYQLHSNGVWNYTDREISRTLPNLSSGAKFYFALFDVDDSTDDDFLGSHYTSIITESTSGPSTNNNDLPFSASSLRSCDNDTVSNDGVSSRFDLDYNIWFSDDTAPSKMAAPVHYDADTPSGYDNDHILNFNWIQASDPHSGISSQQVYLWKDGVPVVGNPFMVSVVTTSATVCSSGCTINHLVVDGSTYKLKVRALNGATISLESPEWSVWSDYSTPVTVNPKFTVGGNVSGLATGSSLVVQNNGQDTMAIIDNGPYAFATGLSVGSSYLATVLTQPAIPSQTCTISNGHGTVPWTNVNNVNVNCATTCEVDIVSGVTVDSAVSYNTCEILLAGPSFIAEDGASVEFFSGWEIYFLPGFTIEQGATMDAKVCGQSLCMTSPTPMPYGCHPCVNQICDFDSSCCDTSFDQACLDEVNTTCGLVCD